MMRIKYINPNSELPYVSEVTDAFMAHDIDEDGNELPSFVIILNCSDSAKHAISIRGASFAELTELINELYDNGKIDISTNANVEVMAIPKSIMAMFDILDDSEPLSADIIDSIINSIYGDGDEDEDDDYDDEEDY
jgi:hypothetical protein